MSFLNHVLNAKNLGILGLFGAVAVGIPLSASVAKAQDAYYIRTIDYGSPQIQQRTATVKLVNNTGEPVVYDVSGRTGVGMVPKDEDLVLENVFLPATISVATPENEYLRVIPLNSQNNYLQINIEEGNSEDWQEYWEEDWGATNINEILEIQDDGGRIWVK